MEEETYESPNLSNLSPISQAVSEVVQEIDNQFTPVNAIPTEETNPEVIDSIALTEMLNTPPPPTTYPVSTPLHHDVQGSTGHFVNLFYQWRDNPKTSPGNTLASENINMFLQSQTPIYDSSIPRMPEAFGTSKFPSDLPTQLGSLGSYCQTKNAPLSSSDKAPLSSQPSVDKDDSFTYGNNKEVMAAKQKMRTQHDKQMKKIWVQHI